MISLNDYLYNGDTVLKILHNYATDLRNHSAGPVDDAHVTYLTGITEFLEHNDFLTSQSQRIREFYKYMAEQYPFLAFTFKGRIKSLIRAEEKFNRNLITLTDRESVESGLDFTEINAEDRAKLEEAVADRVLDIRDLIAYRIIISMPRCHVGEGQDAAELEEKYLYEIAAALPDFLEKFDFQAEKSAYAMAHPSERIPEKYRDYYKDYVRFPRQHGYQSIHITFLDQLANVRFEIQIRTKEMDDQAEIGFADHALYEASQDVSKDEQKIPRGALTYYDEAYDRLQALTTLDLSTVDVNMFRARSNVLINDGCGLFRGRLILPYEHLSRFQNDLIG